MVLNSSIGIKRYLFKILSPTGQIAGTGFGVGGGYILTALHIVASHIEANEKIDVVAIEPIVRFQAEVSETFKDYDIAILKINATDLGGLPLAEIGEGQLGNPAWIYGFQLAKRLAEEPYLASATTGPLDSSGKLVLDSAALGGMSGAPVFNLTCRKVVGVVTHKVTQDEDGEAVSHVTLATPIETVTKSAPWLRTINDRAIKHSEINYSTQFKHQIARILRDDLDASVETDAAVGQIILDILASFNIMGRQQRTAIRCYPEAITPNLIMEFYATIQNLRAQAIVDDGRIITDEPITDEARNAAKEFSIISCITKRDLEDGALGVQSYLQRLIQDYEQYEQNNKNNRVPIIPEMSTFDVHHYYVDLDAVDEQGKRYEPIDDFFQQWLDDSTSNLSIVQGNQYQGAGHVSLFGQSGSGKTSFCLHLAYEMARRHRTEGSGRIPLYVSLRDYSPNAGLENLITSVVDNYKLKTNANGIFRYTVEAGRFLVIFDGFDAMAASSRDDELQNQFREINKYAQKRGKVILTCRTNFFRLEKDAKSITAPNDTATDLLRQSQRHKVNILYVEPFEEPKIVEFLSRHPSIDGNADEWWKAAQKVSNLATLSTMPMLLRMLVETVPSIEQLPKGAISIARLYGDFIIKLLDENQKTGRTRVLTGDDCHLFLRFLALDLLGESKKTFTWDNLLPLSKQLAAKLVKEKNRHPNLIEYDLRMSPLLQRRGDEFAFIHESFSEFLVAVSVARFLTGQELLSEVSYLYALTEEVRRFVVGVVGIFREEGMFNYLLDSDAKRSDESMIFVPAGPFIAGGYDTKLEIKSLDRSVFIGKYPVTWREFETFKPNTRKQNSINAADMAPATNVSWKDAIDYCDWLNQQDKDRLFRLPSEDEWEKAARGIDGRLYPWGEEANHELANYGNELDGPVPVNSYPAGLSPYGLWGMSGNIFEMTSSSLDNDVTHIIRGGSWENPASEIRCSARHRIMAEFRSLDVGFRIASEVRS